MNYYSEKSEKSGKYPFHWKDEMSVVPEDSRPIDQEAKEYYETNKEKLNINLDNVPGDKITLEGIMEYGIDPEAVRRIQLDRLKEELSATDYKIIKCSEHQLAGLPLPYDVSALHAERQVLRDEINNA